MATLMDDTFSSPSNFSKAIWISATWRRRAKFWRINLRILGVTEDMVRLLASNISRNFWANSGCPAFNMLDTKECTVPGRAKAKSDK